MDGLAQDGLVPAGRDPSYDDLSYDDLRYEEAPSVAGPLLAGLVVLLIAVLGAPQVWDALRSRHFGPELVFYPVLALALGQLALRRAR